MVIRALGTFAVLVVVSMLAGCDGSRSVGAAGADGESGTAYGSSGADGGSAASTSSEGDRTTETSTETYPAVSRLAVDSDAGNIEILPGSDDASEVTSVLRWSGDARPEVTQTVEGDTLRVTSRCPRLNGEQCSTDFTVTLPATAAVEASVAAGGVEVRDLRGTQRLSSAAGSVSATGLRATDVRVEAKAGSIDLEFADAPQTVDAQSKAGNVRIALPSGPYRIDAGTVAGRVKVGVDQDPGADRRITARTVAGSVTIEPN
ncbi:MAG: DUF4097 family beta strand repeat-containing protein [Pseudonocardia sp.]